MDKKGLFRAISNDAEVNEYIKKGNDVLGTFGITDHSAVHTMKVAKQAEKILKAYGYDAHCIELAKIAGYMHDIGNAINRTRHAEYGAILSNEILKKYDISIEDRIEIVSCISNHDESTGRAFDAISAALIIADKSDVRRNRVRIKDKSCFDIHDRVNYAVTKSEIIIEKGKIILQLEIDEDSCSMYDYFDIFLGRMQMCRYATGLLGAKFKLIANGNKVL